jgi:hypothetical protein
VRAIAAGCSQTHNRQAQYAQSQLLAYTLVVNTGIANLFDFFFGLPLLFSNLVHCYAGVVLGFSYAQTRNLLTPITIHAFWNSGVILLLTFLQVCLFIYIRISVSELFLANIPKIVSWLSCIGTATFLLLNYIAICSFKWECSGTLWGVRGMHLTVFFLLLHQLQGYDIKELLGAS